MLHYMHSSTVLLQVVTTDAYSVLSASVNSIGDSYEVSFVQQFLSTHCSTIQILVIENFKPYGTILGYSTVAMCRAFGTIELSLVEYPLDRCVIYPLYTNVMYPPIQLVLLQPPRWNVLVTITS